MLFNSILARSSRNLKVLQCLSCQNLSESFSPMHSLASSYKYSVLRLEFYVESEFKSDMVCKELNMKQS